MQTLTPGQAAAIARGVYLLRTDSPSTLVENGSELGFEGLFKVQDNSRFSGQSGVLAWKKLSGFGYISEGEGRYKGEFLCVTRGTATIHDWLSNANVAVQAGPSGTLVHAGFHRVWQSFSGDLRAFLRGKNPTHIHCVGHSLGGALAALNADFFSSSGIASASLYTFGAPRAGTASFSKGLTQRLGPSRIFRVSHIADPVPMIPTFPFLHLPYSGSSYTVGKGVLSVGAHNMLKSYGPLVEGRQWKGLATDNAVVQDRQVEAWLDAASKGKGGIRMHSAEALRMLGIALRWLLKKAGAVAGLALTGMTVGLTLLDQIAWVLTQGMALSKELTGYGVAFIRAVMHFLGKAVKTTLELTTAFLRWILEVLFKVVATAASAAVGMLGAR